MILHTVNKPPSHAALADCLAVMASDDLMLLIEDGVYCLHEVSSDTRVHVLTPDLDARGLRDRLPAELTAVDYAGFVALCARVDKIKTWA
ncbi:MAG: sulfurtransferase complex subunit TusB [Pseudomonadota bacterium]